MLGVTTGRPPSWREILTSQRGAWRLPIHVKMVPPINLFHMFLLPTIDDTPKARFHYALRWVSDPQTYNDLPVEQRGVAETKLHKEDLRRMLEAGQIRPAEPEEITGYVHLFHVVEWAKQRRRAIKHTAAINEHYGKETLMPMHLPLREEQSAQTLEGRWAITVDFSAYFDQFPLHDEIARRMGFRKGNTHYILTRMPMGQRHSVAVAQLATELLLSFEMPPGTTAQAFVDNIRFVGTRQGVMAATAELARRCDHCGVTINELPKQATSDNIEALLHQQGDWLGAHYDYARGTQCVAQKTLAKIKVSWEQRAEWTTRQYAAHVGLLFFATSVLFINVASYFEAMKRLRARAREVEADEALWDAKVWLCPTELTDLERWTQVALENVPTECRSVDEHPGKVIVTDASDWGWGALFWDVRSGRTAAVQAQWSAMDKQQFDTSKSVYAEPEAVYRALCRFVVPSSSESVLVLTDNTAARWALAKGVSPSFFINKVACRVRNTFPNLRLRLSHVPGQHNPADQISRGGYAPSTQEIGELVSRAVTGSRSGSDGGEHQPR